MYIQYDPALSCTRTVPHRRKRQLEQRRHVFIAIQKKYKAVDKGGKIEA